MIKTIDEMKYAVESLRFRLPQVAQVITAVDTQQLSDADRYLIIAYYALMELCNGPAPIHVVEAKKFLLTNED